MTRSRYYRLAGDGRTPLPIELHELSAVMDAPRHVGDDTKDGVRVSTVFLVIDHAWDDGPPVLWETLVFLPGGGEDGERYTTYEAAEAGHARYVAKYHGGAR